MEKFNTHKLVVTTEAGNEYFIVMDGHALYHFMYTDGFISNSYRSVKELLDFMDNCVSIVNIRKYRGVEIIAK